MSGLAYGAFAQIVLLGVRSRPLKESATTLSGNGPAQPARPLLKERLSFGNPSRTRRAVRCPGTFRKSDCRTWQISRATDSQAAQATQEASSTFSERGVGRVGADSQSPRN